MAEIVIIDSQLAGISGDMLLSSLVDAGASQEKIIRGVLGCQDFIPGSKIEHISFSKTLSYGFSATEFHFKYKDSSKERKGIDMYRDLARYLDSLNLTHSARAFALSSLKTIISAEATVHGEDFNSVHLHEASSIDTYADIIGCAIALEDLGLYQHEIISTNVAVGGGLFEFSHGTIPNPGNAILEIFKSKEFTLEGGAAKTELTTPTGAAMLVNLAAGSIDHYPKFSPKKIGYGAGKKKIQGLPNVLRVVIGSKSSTKPFDTETVFVIETNIDDLTDEMIGNIMELMSEHPGVKDITVLQGITKKNRPAHIIKIITDYIHLDTIIEMMFSQTGTLGIRVQELQRYVVPRSITLVPVKIRGQSFAVNVKIAKDNNGKIISTKPEFEDIKKISVALGMPLKGVRELVMIQIISQTGVDGGDDVQ